MPKVAVVGKLSESNIENVASLLPPVKLNVVQAMVKVSMTPVLELFWSGSIIISPVNFSIS